MVDLERRPSPVGRVGEHVVDKEGATFGQMGHPPLVVGVRRFGTVATVYEHQGKWSAPGRGHRRRVADNGHHGAVQTGVTDGAPELRQGVDQP